MCVQRGDALTSLAAIPAAQCQSAFRRFASRCLDEAITRRGKRTTIIESIKSAIVP